MSWLVLLLACAEKPSADDTAAHSGADDTAETGDSGAESGDSTGDSADSAETADTTDSAETADTSDTAHTGDSADTADTAETAETGDTAPEGPPTAAECFGPIWGDGTWTVPDYDAEGVVMNSACTGTNHQDIRDIQRVVFIGDSITVGSPPTNVSDFYRNQLADWLVTRYGLEAPGWDWEWYDVVNGTTIVQESGDFASCAKWGARTDDLIEDNDQVVNCLAEDKRDLTTLVVITMGGNDLYSLVEDYYAGIPEDELWPVVYNYMQLMREAVAWMTDDPTKFPNGIYVVFANLYEFTDALGNVDACPGADSLGFDYDLAAPTLVDMITYSQEEYASIAVETGTDLMFMGEAFCGHGYNAADTSGRCYRGAESELWFDLTCFHPNGTGHTEIAELFESVVEE